MPRLAAFAIVVLLFSIVFASSVQPQTSAVRQASEIAHPILGVHTRLTDEVEEWKINKTMEMARDMGARWVVEYFPWTYVESAKGRFDWAHVDLVVEAAEAQGLTLIARIDNVPQWARPSGTNDRFANERTYQDYGDFVYAFALRYKGRIGHYIVWNEPNLTQEWGFRPVNPEAYVALLKVAYSRLKEADPAIQVLPAAMAPTIERSNDALDDLVYLQRMYDAGLKDYYDIMNIHSYGWRLPPADPAKPETVNFARAALVRDIMVKNGDSAKKAIITEGGWNDHPRWTKAVRPAQRVDYTVQSIQMAERDWPWLEGLCFWTFRLPFPARNYNDQFTFVDQEFRPKPVYDAVRDYAVRR